MKDTCLRGALWIGSSLRRSFPVNKQPWSVVHLKTVNFFSKFEQNNKQSTRFTLVIWKKKQNKSYRIRTIQMRIIIVRSCEYEWSRIRSGTGRRTRWIYCWRVIRMRSRHVLTSFICIRVFIMNRRFSGWRNRKWMMHRRIMSSNIFPGTACSIVRCMQTIW